MNQHKLMRMLRRQGFVVKHTGSGHIKVIPPSGEFVIMPSSPGGGRAWANQMQQLKRIGFDPQPKKKGRHR